MLTEEQIERECIKWFQQVGYEVVPSQDAVLQSADPDALNPLRATYSDVVLKSYLQTAVENLNPHLPAEVVDDVMTTVIDRLDAPTTIENNKQLHQYLTQGVPCELPQSDSNEHTHDRARLIDYGDRHNNSFVVVQQFTVQGAQHTRRPDVVVFINGLPLVVLELKNPTAGQDTKIWQAFDQVQTYIHDIPQLFNYNLACVISDGIEARVGSLTAPQERYHFWRTLKTEKDKPNFEYQLETLVKGFFDPELLLDYIRYFVVFEQDKGQLPSKKIAAYHQFHAVREAVNSAVVATADVNDGKCGVVWHTQGSGKSMSMCCFAAKLMQQPKMQNPTLVVVTDRQNLDSQLYQTFCHAQSLLNTEPQQAKNRGDLRDLLASRPAGGIIFTTIQKFSLQSGELVMPVLSQRHNIVVISDEAHRSQYGLKAQINLDNKALRYGYATYLRQALPNAGFIGFTGTPIEKDDRNTRAVFGDYVSIYDIQQAVNDKATVPIYYEKRQSQLHIKYDKEVLDDEVDEAIEQFSSDDKSVRKIKQQWAALEKIVTTPTRIQKVAEDIVKHWHMRNQQVQGKAMIVCMSRRACVQMYEALIKLKPEWAGSRVQSLPAQNQPAQNQPTENQSTQSPSLQGQPIQSPSTPSPSTPSSSAPNLSPSSPSGGKAKPDVKDGCVRVVMTGSASDKQDLQPHIYDKQGRSALERRFKTPNDPLKIVIVRDMWLTGFDVPCLHTMYIDKPMRGANLMQSIARVNRIFKNKSGGLIVDYIGLASDLQEALKTYTDSKGKGQLNIDVYEALGELEGHLDHIKQMLRKVDYSGYKDEHKAASVYRQVCDCILGLKDGKQVFCNAVRQMSKAYTLCSTMPEVQAWRTDIAFFQALKNMLTKSGQSSKHLSNEKMQAALRQIVSQALGADKVVTLFDLANINVAQVSIFSKDFLEQIKDMKEKNIAKEIVEQLLKDEIKKDQRTNLLRAQKYSQLLQKALDKYNQKAFEDVQILEELLSLARQMKKDKDSGQDLNLNSDELAFYDALASNKSAQSIMGDEQLASIARELTQLLKEEVQIDWARRESVRAGIRLKIKRILAQTGYPPDKQKNAIEQVLQQAENISQHWAEG